MGLDISVYKPKSIGSLSPKDIEQDDFWELEDNHELSIFKDLFFEKEVQEYDFKKAFEEIFIDEKDFECIGYEMSNEKCITNFRHITEGYLINIIHPPINYVNKIGFICDEVGYQRKGANKRFYADGMWDSPCITDKKTLLEHWEKYFSYKTPESFGGFGDSIEFDLDDKERRDNFKFNIIDKFIEGETFVIYH